MANDPTAVWDIPAIGLLRSLVYLVASLSVTVFFRVPQSAVLILDRCEVFGKGEDAP